MSIKVMSNVWEHSRASGTPLLVLLSLADYADDEGECWPSISSIRTKCRLKDDRHVKRVIHETLESKLHEVIVIPGGGKASHKGGLRSNRYRIVVHLPDEMVVEEPPSERADSGSGTTQMVAEQPPQIVAEQPPESPLRTVSEPPSSLSHCSEPDERDGVVRQALRLIAERRVAARIAGGVRVHSKRAYLRVVLDDVRAEYGDEVAKRHVGNPAFSAEELASMFDAPLLERGTPIEI